MHGQSEQTEIANELHTYGSLLLLRFVPDPAVVVFVFFQSRFLIVESFALLFGSRFELSGICLYQ